MYPLKVVLIGCPDDVLPHVRRELMNCSAEIDAECPNVRSAIAAARKVPGEKRLLIFHLDSSRELEELARLTVGLPGWPILALIGAETAVHGSESGIISIIGIMRAGAAQIVALPIQPHDFKAALARLAIQFVYTAKDSSVIAVAGATGGSGATSIAINLAYEIAFRHDRRCILADLSLRMGAVAAHLNIAPSHTIVDLLKDPSRVDTVLARKVLYQVAENLDVLAGPDHFLTPTKVSFENLSHVVDTLKQMADVVILDVPCTYDDIYFDMLASAGTVVLVGEQTLPSIRALKMVHEQLARRGRTEHLVINRFDPKNRGFAVDRLLKPLGVSSVMTIARDDTTMSAAIEAGSALRVAAQRSPALTDIVALTDVLLTPPATARAKPLGLIGRLGRAFANS